jgi:hypothetical protein
MYLFLEDRPLLRLPALRVGSTAIFGKEGLLAKIIQATLFLGVIGHLCDARLAEEIGEVILALVPCEGRSGCHASATDADDSCASTLPHNPGS